MKILAMCQGGHVRSVSAKFLLHYGQMGTPPDKWPKHDVLACGWQSNSEQTREMLYWWADKIVILDARFKQFVAPHFHKKLVVLDVGDDRFGFAFNPELMSLLSGLIEANKEHFTSEK